MPSPMLLRRTAYTATALAFALVVLGGIVRITGSGMGCGDDWPKCNGEWFPPLDLPTFIEIFHRWVAVLVSIAVVTTAALTWLKHRGRGHLIWPASLAVVLLVTQILLGAVTVKLELPPWAVILHFVNAMLLLTALLVTALRAGQPAEGTAATTALRSPLLLWATALLGFGVVILGAHVANLDAGPACQGFPLCLGGGGVAGLLPPPGGQAAVHWVHRVAAYGFLALVLVLCWRGLLRAGEGPFRTALIGVALLTLAQVGVAAGMVLLQLPGAWRAAHLLVGVAIWVALVVLLHQARRATPLGRG